MKNALLVIALAGSISPVFAAQSCPNQLQRVAPNSRYIDHLDGTVTDTATGLMWKKCSEGLSGAACSIGTASLLNWENALQAASNSVFAGYNDWRLPNLPELASLIETGCHNPTINSDVFPGTRMDQWYMSSTVNHLSGGVHSILFRDANSAALDRESFALSRHVRSVGTLKVVPQAFFSGDKNIIVWLHDGNVDLKVRLAILDSKAADNATHASTKISTSVPRKN